MNIVRRILPSRIGVRIGAITLVLAVVVVALLIGVFSYTSAQLAAAAPAEQSILQARGRLNFLRVHDVGTGYGPRSDSLDGEVIFGFQGDGNRYGFQLRNNNNLAARQGMLDLLLNAYNNNLTVVTDYRDDGGSNNFAFRVWLEK